MENTEYRNKYQFVERAARKKEDTSTGKMVKCLEVEGNGYLLCLPGLEVSGNIKGLMEWYFTYQQIEKDCDFDVYCDKIRVALENFPVVSINESHTHYISKLI